MRASRIPDEECRRRYVLPVKNPAHLYPAKVSELRAILVREVCDKTARQSNREELGGAVRN